MRVTSTLVREQWLSALNRIQQNIAKTQRQISTDERFSSPADDPVGAARVNQLDQAIAQNQQYTRNADIASNRLNLEESVIAQVTDRLSRLRDLTIQANSGVQSAESRASIAAEVKQIQSDLLTLSNSQDGGGQYLFAGYASKTQPFSLTGSAVQYNGDQGRRGIEIASGQSIYDGDSGAAVFEQIKNGNGVFRVDVDPANTGSGLAGKISVLDPAAYPGGNLTISFTAPDAYEVRDASNNLIASGAFTAGQTLSFQGLQVEITGSAAAGDRFTVSPSQDQSIFTTVQNLVTALSAGGSSPAANTLTSNRLGFILNDLDQAIGKTLEVRANVGARLSAIDAQKSLASDRDLQLKTILSNVKDVDYADAMTRLSQETTSLEAAQKAFAQTQGLSLFRYL